MAISVRRHGSNRNVTKYISLWWDIDVLPYCCILLLTNLVTIKKITLVDKSKHILSQPNWVHINTYLYMYVYVSRLVYKHEFYCTINSIIGSVFVNGKLTGLISSLNFSADHSNVRHQQEVKLHCLRCSAHTCAQSDNVSHFNQTRA